MLVDNGKRTNKKQVNLKDFGERLSKLREGNCLKRKELYKKMEDIKPEQLFQDYERYSNIIKNGSKNLIWSYEKGHSIPTIAKLNKLADILDVSPFYLLYGFKFLDYFYDKFIAKIAKIEIILSEKNEYLLDEDNLDPYFKFAGISRSFREYLFKSSVQSYQELAYGEGLYTKDRKKISLQEASLIFANLFKKVTGFNDFIKAPFWATNHKDILPAQLFHIDFSKKAQTQKNIKQRNLSFEYDFSISLDDNCLKFLDGFLINSELSHSYPFFSMNAADFYNDLFKTIDKLSGINNDFYFNHPELNKQITDIDKKYMNKLTDIQNKAMGSLQSLIGEYAKEKEIFDKLSGKDKP